MLIRSETPNDRDGVFEMISAAFGQEAEARFVQALHEAGDGSVALVAEEDGLIVGHVLLSPIEGPFPALALAPLAVHPERQGTGVGSALVREALARTAHGSWRAVFVLGAEGYYGRFGFSRELASGFSSPYAGEHFMALALNGELPVSRGELSHAPAFAALG